MKKTVTLKSRKLRPATKPRRISAACKRHSPGPEDQAVVHSQPDPEIPEAEALEQARRLVVCATPGITKSIIEQAKQGSYLHARMLFDFAGLTAVQAPQSASISPVLEMLLREMEAPPPKPALS